ncbi:MAG: hypothetical protein CMH01_01075 [Marinovum sp.]|nr:hypothetical protein [Marinovum sp.]
MTLVYDCLMQNTKIQTNLKKDGRRLRSITSQNIIVDALLVLLKKGILEPTAQQIADEAGISIRTVFRQIEDMETLFSKMNEKIKYSYKEMIDNTEPKGDLSERIKDLIILEARVFENNLQYIKSTLSLKFKYKVLQNNYQKVQKDLKIILYKWLPEVNNLDNSYQTLLNSINSTGYWVELRETQMLSAEEATKFKINIFKNILLKNNK